MNNRYENEPIGYLQTPGETGLKYLSIFHQVCLMIIGSVALGIGVWMALWTGDLNYVGIIMEADLYVSSYILLIISGVFMIGFALVGCCGSIQENSCLLLTYLIVVIITMFCLLASGILAFVLNLELRNNVESKFVTAIEKYYGISKTVARNAEVTSAIDILQRKYGCCGSYGGLNSTKSWFIYKNSSAWYQETVKNGPPYVPESCCVLGTDGTFKDKAVCQGSTPYTKDPLVAPINNPPLKKSNPNLYESGCVTVLNNSINMFSLLLGGLGIGIAVYVFFGMAITCALLRMIEVAKWESTMQDRTKLYPAEQQVAFQSVMRPAPASRSVARQPAVGPAPASRSVAGQPAVGRAPASRSVAGQPAVGPAPASRSVAGQHAVGPAPASRSVAGQPAVGPAPASRSVAGQPAVGPAPANQSAPPSQRQPGSVPTGRAIESSQPR